MLFRSEKQLDSLKKAEDCEEREFLLENLTVEQMYEEYFRENEEDNGKKDDEEFFNERYNEKKRKYDKIKELMGDEIDEEINNAKKDYMRIFHCVLNILKKRKC